MNTIELDEIKQAVRKHYTTVATRENGCGCAPTCCSTGNTQPNTRTADEMSQALGYSAEQTGTAPQGANLGLGCGICEWFPGRGIEDYIVSATIEAVKS